MPSREFNIFVSAASIDLFGVESLFSEEKISQLTGLHTPTPASKAIELFQNKPNPFDESTLISFWVEQPSSVKEANILITDLQGKKIKEIPVIVHQGMNEVLYEHGYNMTGTFLYSLYVNGKLVSTKKMVFSN